jgi:hypothetical protein
MPGPNVAHAPYLPKKVPQKNGGSHPLFSRGEHPPGNWVSPEKQAARD